MNPTLIGKAWIAFQAYNFKLKHNRMPWELKRWVRVVEAIEAREPKAKGTWSAARRKKYAQTISKRRGSKPNGSAARP